MSKQKRTWDVILVVVMVLLCLLWIYPIVLILLNSLKTEGSFTTSTVFRLPTAETFAGLRNYVYGVTKMDFLSSMGYSLLITITSVVLILLCCSMTGWYLTRVNNKLSKFMNLLIVFSMVVPFQMVMFTLSKTADRLNLNNPWNICIIYLGFGAGLAVFMFTGFMKSVPMEIEEAAMIDGCNPIQIFFKVVFPHPEAYHDLHCYSGDHVGVERLPAAHAGAGYQEVPHHPHGDPVFPRRLRPCGPASPVLHPSPHPHPYLPHILQHRG